MPKLYSIHKAKVVSIQTYGAFVQLGDGTTYKDGLLHVSRISASGRIEAVGDVLAEGDAIWVKVVEVNEDTQKHSLDMRHVRQKDGEDLDPTNAQVDTGRGGKGGGKPEPIRIGAVQATTCSRCGARGHMARECFAAGGSSYNLLEDGPDDAAVQEAVPGLDPKLVKAALKAYMDKKESKEKKREKKEAKKAKKKEKKEKKKEKKEKKKAKQEKKSKKAEAPKGEASAKGHGTSKEPRAEQAARPAPGAARPPAAPRGAEEVEPISLAAALAGVSSSSSSSSS